MTSSLVEILHSAIIGYGSLRPWEIIIIFFSVAYASVSTDITGIFDFIAYKIVRWANGHGMKLFTFFYLFACLLTAFTSNDIVILTLTPIIFYLGKHAKINVVPLLFAEFFGANTLSMLLYIGNPTNIIVGNALHLNFLEYTKVMWLPTIVAAVLNIVLLWLIFRKSITLQYKINQTHVAHVRNWLDAVISLSLLFAMLVTLSLSSNINLPIWVITSIFAGIFIIEDLIFSTYYYFRSIHVTPTQLEKLEMIGKIPKIKNEFFLAIKRMPWKILPLVVSFFILVATLNYYGIIDWLVSIVIPWCNSLGASIFSLGTLSLISVNIINNQPASVLFSYLLVNPGFGITPTNQLAGAYALIIASNLGANITLIGALAGLMWKKILKDKGIEISYWQFFKKGLIITPLVFYITLFTLYLVLK